MVVIIGAGPSGLSVAGALKHRGIASLLLDKDTAIGGTWARRYERLRLHTIRSFSGLAHYPLPRALPRYLPKDSFAAYLQDYAKHFDLDIRLGCTVQHITPSSSDSSWQIETNDGPLSAQVVVVTTGQHRDPILPSWPDQEQYTGQVLHSSSYRTGSLYQGQRILVVGSGNTGTEIATDLVEQGAAHVALSVRTPPAIVPRDAVGLPVQVAGMVLSRLPTGLADWIGSMISRLWFGQLTRYGLKPAAWRPYSDERIPTIDVGFVRELKRGRIQIRPAIKGFMPQEVIFTDGQQEVFDAVILATGFRTGLNTLVDLPGLLDKDGFPLYPQGQPTPYPGLFFLGYTYSLRGQLYEINNHSRQLAARIARGAQKGHA